MREKRNAYRSLVGKLEENRLLGRSKLRWEDESEIKTSVTCTLRGLGARLFPARADAVAGECCTELQHEPRHWFTMSYAVIEKAHFVPYTGT
jgi:hypothetical protein